MRKLVEKRLVLATHNRGKLLEFKELLAPYGIDATAAANLSLGEPDEAGKTFDENAAIKASAAATAAGMPALADDSGLAVTALDGAPGIYSARWAGPKKNFGAAMDKVEKALKDRKAEDYSAKFICVLCLAWPDGHTEFFRGEVAGSLSFPPRGNGGFGYDPIFTATGQNKTFAEIDPAEKQALSHRAVAFRDFEMSCLQRA